MQVFPSYSAYLFVADTIGSSRSLKIANIYPGRQANGSTITTAGGDTSSGQLVIYGFWDESHPTSTKFPTKLALLNLQIYNQTQDGIRPTASFNISSLLSSTNMQISVRRLQAPGADTQLANVTKWAGQTFEDGTASGLHIEEKIEGGIVTVEASSAALVFLNDARSVLI